MKNSAPSQVYILAEAGVNHNGNIDTALKLIDAAVAAGVDGVKFQTFNVAQLVAATAKKASYQKDAGKAGETQGEMLEKLVLSQSDHHRLKDHCKEQNIDFLSTPFDCDSLNFLTNNLGLTNIKLSSGAITHGPLLLAAGQSGANIILSTGLSNLGEVEQALMVLAYGLINRIEPPSQNGFSQAYATDEGQKALQDKVTLLHCTTQYPAPMRDINLLAMDILHKAFALNVGFSDHSLGISAPLAAVARGAKVIEKHFTLDKTMAGPDHKASLSVDELQNMVRGIREVELALGVAKKFSTNSENENRNVVRSSLTALKDIAKGTVFSEENLGVKRPGNGISPIYYWSWLGQRASRDFAKDEAIE
ncbi:MAG: N-acetylneuraminate synthase [Magnetococcales bacterium]|nr:N-acetylneuraminate synthase [Magnetococcales bacterium]